MSIIRPLDIEPGGGWRKLVIRARCGLEVKTWSPVSLTIGAVVAALVLKAAEQAGEQATGTGWSSE